MRPILFAHLVTVGLGPVYDGIAHVLVSPEDLRRLPPPAIAVLSGTVGMLHGWFNGADMADEVRDPMALVGTAGTIFVLTALSSARIVSLTAPWSRIAVRVAGSWVAAIGLLMFGWALQD